MKTYLSRVEGLDRFGMLLMILGCLYPSFLIISPNRIESGIPVSIFRLGEDSLFFPLALFLILGALVGASLQKKKPRRNLVISLVFFWLYLFTIGRIAQNLLVSQTDSSRISLGFGFWLYFSGMMIQLRQRTKHLMERYSHDPRAQWIPTLSYFIALIGIFALYGFGFLDSISIIKELLQQKSRIGHEFLRHMQLTLHSVLTGIVLSFLFSYGAYKKTWLEKPIDLIANFFQVIPTLSLLGLLMVPLSLLVVAYPVLKSMGISGIGYFPAYLVLTSYTLLPLIRHFLAGFRSIPEDLLEGARGMGMTSSQILLQIEFPLALPAIYTGIRTALVQTVSNAILAGLVGGGGLGALLFLGLAQSALDLVVVSSLLVVLVSVTLNLVMTGVETSSRLWQKKEVPND